MWWSLSWGIMGYEQGNTANGMSVCNIIGNSDANSLKCVFLENGSNDGVPRAGNRTRTHNLGGVPLQRY